MSIRHLRLHVTGATDRGPVDHRTDLFSVGVIIAEALIGQEPFGGSTFAELVARVLHGEYHLPVSTAAARRLDEVIQRCVAKSERRALILRKNCRLR